MPFVWRKEKSAKLTKIKIPVPSSVSCVFFVLAQFLINLKLISPNQQTTAGGGWPKEKQK